MVTEGGPAHARLTYGRGVCSGHYQDTQTRAQRLMMQVFGPNSRFLVFLQPAEGFAKRNRKHPAPFALQRCPASSCGLPASSFQQVISLSELAIS